MKLYIMGMRLRPLVFVRIFAKAVCGESSIKGLILQYSVHVGVAKLSVKRGFLVFGVAGCPYSLVPRPFRERIDLRMRGGR